MTNTECFTVYKASAGSGKTFTLAVEYIAMMLSQPGDTEYQRILAVTFTNLATAEMKSRIVEYLYGLAHYEAESVHNAHLRSVMVRVGRKLTSLGLEYAEKDVEERARRCMTALLHDYDRFRVETIDSFFQSVVRSLAHELGLNARLQVELNDKQLVAKAVDRVVENLRDTSDDRVRRWVDELVTTSIGEGRSWDVIKTVKTFSECIYEESFQSRADRERDALRSEEYVTQFSKRMHAIVESSKKEMQEAAERLVKAVEQQTLNFERISRGSTFRAFLEKVKCLEQARVSDTMQRVSEGEWDLLLRAADKKGAEADLLTAEAQVTSEALAQLLETYRTLYADAETARLTLRHINELLLLGTVEDTASEIAEENSQFPLSRTPALLSQLVGSEDSPFVFEKAGTQFRHVMIDEFQDTSRLQWNNFRVLLLEYLASGGSNLVVGDVKQSIYRWRNGDWKILQGIDSDTSLPVRPRSVQLDTNFRSLPKVVDFNGQFFHEAAQLLDNLTPPSHTIADIYADVMQKTHRSDGEGYVRVQIFSEERASDEAYIRHTVEAMIEQTERLFQLGIRPEDIAILVRFNKTGAMLIDYFRQMAPHLTLVSNEAYLLEASSSVQTIVAALRLLSKQNEDDRLTERQLCKYWLSSGGNLKVEPEQWALSDPQTLLPAEFTERRSELARLPLYMLCEELYRIFRPAEAEGQDAYMMTFFDELQNHLRNAQPDIASFLQAWDEVIHTRSIPSGNIRGIRIFTIHKSKGLQFPVVFAPFMDFEIEGDRRGSQLWCRASDSRFNTLGPLPVSMSSSLERTYYGEAYADEHFQRRVDALNTLYVAFTRAEDNLFVWGMTPRKRKDDATIERDSTVGDLIRTCIKQMGHSTRLENESLLMECGTPTLSARQTSEEGRMSTRGSNLTMRVETFAPRLNFLQSNESQRFVASLGDETADSQTYTDIGKIMHFVLSQVRTLDDVPRVLEACRKDGIIEDERMSKRVFERLNKGFSNPKVRHWFTDGDAINENNIIGCSRHRPEQKVHRPDRVVLTDTDVTVIDYKFGRKNTDYHNQVRAYMDLLHQMYPTRHVEGYLWYVYSGEVVSVPETDNI